MKNLALLIVIFSFGGCFGKRPTVISGLEGKPIPSFNFLLTDSVTRLNTDNIPAGQSFVIFFFSPFCPYCKAQTEELKEDIKSVENVNFYFVSAFPLYQLKKYDEQYGLSKYKNITIAQIKDTAFTKYYKISGVPYIAVYNAKKQLKEVLLGKVSTSDIRNAAIEN